MKAYERLLHIVAVAPVVPDDEEYVSLETNSQNESFISILIHRE